jgi:hypothetical protein
MSIGEENEKRTRREQERKKAIKTNRKNPIMARRKGKVFVDSGKANHLNLVERET